MPTSIKVIRDDLNNLALGSTKFLMFMVILVSLSAVVIACDSESTSTTAQETEMAGETAAGEPNQNTGVQALFEVSPIIYETALGMVPFPHDLYRDENGFLKLDGFPNQSGVLAKLVDELESSNQGFGTTSGFFVSFSDQIDLESLPSDGGESIRDDALISLVDIDPNSPELDVDGLSIGSILLKAVSYHTSVYVCWRVSFETSNQICLDC